MTFCKVYFTFETKYIMKEKLENRLKVFRAEKNITQEDLGKACGLSRQSINAIEKGKYTPTVISAIKIANHFNVNVEEIFKITGGSK